MSGDRTTRPRSIVTWVLVVRAPEKGFMEATASAGCSAATGWPYDRSYLPAKPVVHNVGRQPPTTL
jgi:hypothetical protein